MPAARAQEMTLEASGAVLQAVIKDGPVTLAKVTDGPLQADEWGPSPSARPIFGAAEIIHPGSAPGKPGSSGTYECTLTNLYYGPISYTFERTGFLGTGLARTQTDMILYRVTGMAPAARLAASDAVLPLADNTPIAGQLEEGESVKFTLQWFWDGMVDWDDDTDAGMRSTRENRTQYAAELKFTIEAVPIFMTLKWVDSATGAELGKWEGLRPGMTIAEALEEGYELPAVPTRSGYKFLGFTDQDGTVIMYPDGTVNGAYAIWPSDWGGAQVTAQLVLEAEWERDTNWLLLLIPGGLAVGGLALGAVKLPWLLALAAAPVLALAGWKICKHHKDCLCPKDCDGDNNAADYEEPPKTGDDWNPAILSGAGLALAAAAMLMTLRRRRREEGGCA